VINNELFLQTVITGIDCTHIFRLSVYTLPFPFLQDTLSITTFLRELKRKRQNRNYFTVLSLTEFLYAWFVSYITFSCTEHPLIIFIIHETRITTYKIIKSKST
jgi:hypothetical protein